MNEQKYTVTIAKTAYTIKTDESQEVVDTAVHMINTILDHMATLKTGSSETIEKNKLVFTCLQLAIDQTKLNEQLQSCTKRLEQELATIF